MNTETFLMIVGNVDSSRDERVSDIYHGDDVYNLVESIYRTGYSDGVSSVHSRLRELYEDGRLKYFSPSVCLNADEKQIPKKVTENGYGVYFCPVCSGSVWQCRDESKYCFRCGQALDWNV